MTGHVGYRELSRKGKNGKERKTGKRSYFYTFAPRKVNGKWIQVTKRGFATERAAEDALRKAIVEEQERGERDPRSFSEFFSLWIDGHAPNCGAKTVERYRELAEYAIKRIGDIAVPDLDPAKLQVCINDLRDHGGKSTKKYPKGRPLAAKTVREIAAIIAAVLKNAVGLRVIPSNPMQHVTRPRSDKAEPKHLEADQLERVADRVSGHEWLEVLVDLDSATGARRGELLALEWPDIDLETRSLSITKSLSQTKQGIALKTTKNRRARSFTLPAYAIRSLISHRERQLRNRALLGLEPPERDLVFTNGVDGEYLKPDSVSAKVSLLMRQLGLPKGYSLHSLRHSHATHLISSGAPLPAVSKRLGHANTNVTAQIYVHALQKDDALLADLIDKAMEGSIHTSDGILTDIDPLNSEVVGNKGNIGSANGNRTRI